jgi:hypothetical protein
MVVDTDCVPEPAANSSNTLASGRPGWAGRTVRMGTGPFSTRPRARRYSMASEPSAGRT